MAPQVPVRIALEDIGDVMDSGASDGVFDSLLDRETGEVVHIVIGMDEDAELAELREDDPDRFLDIPRLESSEKYRWMAAFVDSVDRMHDAKDVLSRALTGKGAFRRFKDALHDFPDVEARWFAVRREHLEEEARRWLDDRGIVYEVQRRAPPPPPVAPTPAKQTLDLRVAHVLALGRGEPRVVDGKVRRSIEATPRNPRELFKLLARDLCFVSGIGWRNHFIEGKTSFEREGIRISIEGTTVHVDTEVPADVATLFARR